jgi:hypothetical protein
MNATQKRIIKDNETLTNQELLNWAMNQLFRAARSLELTAIQLGYTHVKGGSPIIEGCDATATCILRRLVKTKKGYNLVKKTNRKLVRGYARP